MEDPTIPLPPLHNSKKRLFSNAGSSSSSFVEPDVIEIPPPATWKSKPSKKISVSSCEVIDLDSEDLDDVVIIDEKVAPNAKGKKPMLNYRAGDKLAANNGSPLVVADDFVNGSSSSCVAFIDDDFEFNGSETIYDDECAMLQAHFDTVDIPSGIEATVPWWPLSAASDNQSVNSSSSSVFGTISNSAVGPSEVDQFEAGSSYKPLPPKKPSFRYAFHEPKFSSTGFAINKSSHAQTSGIGMFAPKFGWGHAPVHVLKNQASINYEPYSFGGENALWWQNAYQGSGNMYMPYVAEPGSSNAFFSGHMQGSSVHDPSIRLDDGISAQILPPSSQGRGDDGENPIVQKLELFKKFDTLEDHSSHLYCNTKNSSSQSRSWANKIADEWRMLERDLPGSIFVRVYEARMDLLRAVIMGADGTPYHDGLFFFDVHFPPSYPNGPPHVKYHAHGLRINPNLYNCGKVCLSLLGTWSGHGAENWRPGQSNMLQVLLSIQGLILNAEPYFNEPGYESSKNSQHGKSQSKHYSENTFLLSLKTMLYTMRNPPKDFEDLVFGHFYTHAHNVLAACGAYLDGVEVGNFDKSKNPAAQVKGSNCSELLKMNLPTYIKSLVEAFTKIGVKGCEKYLVPIDKGSNQPTRGASSSRRRSKLLSPHFPTPFV